MKLEINEEEKELLLEALKSAHSVLRDEAHHTENYDFRQMLKKRDELLLSLRSRIEALSTDGASV